MAVEKKFIKNHLTKETHPHGVGLSLLAVYLCMMATFIFWNAPSELSTKLIANYQKVVGDGEYYRLLTTTFIHGDISHLLSNCLMLYILMYFVTSFYGAFVSLTSTFIMSMLINLIVLSIYGGEINLLGISGVVYYLWGFWMILYLFLQRHYSVTNRILRMGAVFLILLIPSEFRANTSYLAHGVGFGLGVIMGFFYYLFNKDNLHRAETWKVKVVDEELNELDEIALSYPKPGSNHDY